MTPTYVYRAELDRVVDGDTFVFKVDLGFRVFASVTVRLRGLFTAESHEDGGTAATERARQALSAASSIVLKTDKDRMSFARWIADVWVDGELLAEKLATPPAGIGAN